MKGPLFPLFPEGWEGPQGWGSDSWEQKAQSHLPNHLNDLVILRDTDTDIFTLTSAIPAKTCSSSAHSCLVLTRNLEVHTTLLNGLNPGENGYSVVQYLMCGIFLPSSPHHASLPPTIYSKRILQLLNDPGLGLCPRFPHISTGFILFHGIFHACSWDSHGIFHGKNSWDFHHFLSCHVQRLQDHGTWTAPLGR